MGTQFKFIGHDYRGASPFSPSKTRTAALTLNPIPPMTIHFIPRGSDTALVSPPFPEQCVSVRGGSVRIWRPSLQLCSFLSWACSTYPVLSLVQNECFVDLDGIQYLLVCP